MTTETETDAMMQALKCRDELVTRLQVALAHLHRNEALAIVALMLSSEDLEELVKFQENRT